MLINQLRTILNKYGARFVTDLQKQLLDNKTVASKRALSSLSYQIKDNKRGPSLQVRGKKYIRAIDTGTPVEAAYKNPPPTKKILSWVKKKGIKDPKGKMSQKRLAFIIAKTIKERGTIQRFGYKGTNLIKFVLNKNSEPLTEELFNVVKADIEKQIAKQQKNVNKNKS